MSTTEREPVITPERLASARDIALRTMSRRLDADYAGRLTDEARAFVLFQARDVLLHGVDVLRLATEDGRAVVVMQECLAIAMGNRLDGGGPLVKQARASAALSLAEWAGRVAETGRDRSIRWEN